MKLLQNVLDKIPNDLFSDSELIALFPGSGKEASRYNQVKRALAKGDIVRLRRGLYHLAKRYQRQPVNPFILAQRILGPSYVSFESALSYHQLIPEAVYSITSACLKRSQEYKTPLGCFTYTPIPSSVFFESVERITQDGFSFFMATPLKALADYVYAKRLDWEGMDPLVSSLRIEPEALLFSGQEIEELMVAYPSKRVFRFLSQLKKDISL